MLHSSGSGGSDTLTAYFDVALSRVESNWAGDDGFHGTNDATLEQTALLLMHFDADGDGALSPAEFAALIGMVSAKTGQTFVADDVDKMFRDADIDRNGYVDLNELLLLGR